MRNSFKKISIFVALPFVLLGYQNCSQVSGFITEISPESEFNAKEADPQPSTDPAVPMGSESGVNPPEAVLVGSLRVYTGFSIKPGIIIDEITESQALAECQKSVSPITAGGQFSVNEESVLCTWGAKVIFEKYDGECSTTENVCRHGAFSDIQDTTMAIQYECLGVGGGRAVTCNHSRTAPDPTGTSRVYLNKETLPGVTSSNITEAGALANCLFNGSSNPGAALRCTWDSVVLIERDYPPTCSSTVNVCRQGIFSDLQDTSSLNQWTCSALAGGPSVSCSTVLEAPIPLNTSRIFFTGGADIPTLMTDELTEAEALATCTLNARNNPDLRFRCTWGADVLMDLRIGFFPLGFVFRGP